jgi:excisionase family DNA binding protein
MRPIRPLPEQTSATTGGATQERSGPEPALLRIEEAARYLALGRTKTYELVARGAIPSIRLGRVVRIPRDALHRWLEAQIQGATGADASGPARHVQRRSPNPEGER